MTNEDKISLLDIQIRELQKIIVGLENRVIANEDQLERLEAAFVHQSKGYEVIIDTEHDDPKYVLLNTVKKEG